MPPERHAGPPTTGCQEGISLSVARLDAGGGAARTIRPRDARPAVGDDVGVEYVSRVPRPPLDGLIDDLYYLEGAPPYARLTLPAAPAPLLIVNLGAPFHIRAGNDIEAAEYADGCVVSTPTRAWEFGYPPRAGPSACTSSRGGWHRSCRWPRPSCVTGRRRSNRSGAGPPSLSCETSWPPRTNRTRC